MKKSTFEKRRIGKTKNFWFPTPPGICHGRFVLFTVGLPNTKKDGNMSCELLSRCLTIVKNQGQNLSTTQLCLQHDNTCREFKNNNGARWCCSQVFSKNIDPIEASYLRSGHTHTRMSINVSDHYLGGLP